MFDVVLGSFSPLAPHLIAMKFRNSGFRFYWIADMRDEMSKSPLISSNYAMRLNLHGRKIVCRADLVTSVLKPILDDFSSLGCHDGFLEVRNGYDYEEVHDVNFQTCFTMTYTGSFYGSIKPDNWFKAFSELISEGMLPPDSVIKIVGNYSNLNVPQSILANVVLLKPVPHEEALRISIMETDVLVMVHPLGRKGVYSGKLFDYLATNKPILALCDPDDVIAELLKDTGAGFVACESDIGDIKRAIIKCYLLWKNKEVLPRNWDRISQNSRRSQAQILIDYLSAQNTLM